MGILADIYIAAGADAERYHTMPKEFADRLECKGITTLELSMLWAILRGVNWDLPLMDEFKCVSEKDAGERQIHSLPPGMIQDLTGLSSDQLHTLASRWAATEELQWPDDDARDVIEELVRLASLARSRGQGLYLWNSV